MVIISGVVVVTSMADDWVYIDFLKDFTESDGDGEG